METITLNTPSMQGKIYIGEGVMEARLPELTKGQKNFVVTDSNLAVLYADWLKAWFDDAEIFVLPAGEENKNFQSLYAILERMAGAGLRRTARLFAVGGGVVGDIGGLAAALYMRGISCVQIPTSLLAQVDSSVGGKTAVDLGGIKNAVGAFYQPCEVLIEPAFLKTLPEREIKCGLGEIVKYAALSGEIFEKLRSRKERFSDLSFLETLIADCVRYKAKVVEADEKETGERRSLNIGHTTGHAIELESKLSHGECVLWGMHFETQIALEKELCEKNYGEDLLALIEKALWEKPISRADFSEIEKMLKKTALDKKNTEDGEIKTALPKAKGEWSLCSLSFEEYASFVAELVERI